MSAQDTIIGAIVGAAIAIVASVASVVATNWYQDRRRKQARAEKVRVLAYSVQRVMAARVVYIAENRSKLEPLLAENIVSSEPTSDQFRAVLSNALSVFPIPDPEDVQFPKEPEGWTIASMSEAIAAPSKELNMLAEKLKTNPNDRDLLKKFLVAAQKVLDVNIMITNQKGAFETYMDALERLGSRKFTKEERKELTEQSVKDLKELYEVGANMDKVTVSAMRDFETFLKKIGW